MKWLLLALLPLLACCSTIAPAKDFPRLPLPEPTRLEPVAAVKKDGGFWLKEEEFQKVNRMLQGFRLEAETLRKIVALYNAWADERQ